MMSIPAAMNGYLVEILAAAAVGIWVVGYWFAFLKARYRTVRYLTGLVGEQYGFLREQYTAEFDIRPDGSSTVRFFEALSVLNTELEGIEHYSTEPTDRAQLFDQFRLADVTGADVKIEPREILSTPKRLYYQLLFTPPLRPRSAVSYSYSVENPVATFAMSKSEMFARGLPFDYASCKVSYPTKRLDMIVRFPEELSFEAISYDVWLGDARLRLRKEHARLGGALESGREDRRLVARLTVEYPVLGLKYAISWMPVANEPIR